MTKSSIIIFTDLTDDQYRLMSSDAFLNASEYKFETVQSKISSILGIKSDIIIGEKNDPISLGVDSGRVSIEIRTNADTSLTDISNLIYDDVCIKVTRIINNIGDPVGAPGYSGSTGIHPSYKSTYTRRLTYNTNSHKSKGYKNTWKNPFSISQKNKIKKTMISYIIPYKHRPDRLQNLISVIGWVKGISKDIELILVEQDKKSGIQETLGKEQMDDWGIDKCYFIQSDYPFNKSHALNVGLKNSSGDIICFGDSDLIMNPDEFKECIDDIHNYDYINPYQWVIDLNDYESTGLNTRVTMDDLYKIDRMGRGQAAGDIRKVPICGGINIFKRDSIYKIGGYCSEYIGWGCEDNALETKVKKLLNWKQKDYRCYHLNHQPEVPNMTFYTRNLQMLNMLNNMNDESFSTYIKRSVERLNSM